MSPKARPSLALALLNLALAVVMAILARVIVPGLDLSNLVLLDSGKVTAALFVMGFVSAWAIFSVLVNMPLLTLGLALSDLSRGFRGQAALSAGIAWAVLLWPALWMAFGDTLAAREEHRVDLAWARTLEPVPTVMARYPAASTSEGALKLEAASARLGIEMNLPDAAAHPAESDRAALAAVSRELWPFVESQTNKPEEAVEAVPAPVATWLSAHQDAVTALVREVQQAGPITFQTDWSRYDQAVPPAGGLRAASTVLMLFALASERAGDPVPAIEAIGASWRIGGALRDRGDLFSQFGATILDGMTLSGVRKVRSVPSGWTARLTHDYRASALRALEAEAWSMSAHQKRITPGPGLRSPAALLVWRTVFAPYLRLMGSNYSETLRKTVEELASTDPCLLDPAIVDKRAEQSLAWWNIHGRMALPHLGGFWLASVRAALALELTQKVLTLRAVEEQHGAWPTELPGLESAICQARRWDYSTSADGQVSLTISLDEAHGGPLAFRAIRPRTDSPERKQIRKRAAAE